MASLNNWIRIAWCAVFLGGCGTMPGTMPPALPAPPAQVHESSTPIPVIQLAGTPTQIGAQHGQRLADAIHLLHDRYILAIFSDPQRHHAASLAADAFQRYLSTDQREEIGALADASQLDPGEIMLCQCFLDLSAVAACSTITLSPDAAPDHIARFGRNLDFPSLGIADRYTTLFIYHPSGGIQFAVVGWPGMIGAVSGMNELGLTIASMEVPRDSRPPSAMPYSLLYRTILERCRTVDDAINLLQSTPRQSANNLMLMDAAGRRAVAEITPEKVTVRWGADGTALLSTNHQRGQDQDAPGLCPRYDSLHAAAAKQWGAIGLVSLESMLADVRQPGLTMQSMVFEPANRVIYLAAGPVDEGRSPYTRIDLRSYFDGSAGH